MKVRVKFAKYDNMRFIGHLDVMRFFQKALRRAGIDVAYSTGFSPHQIMSLHRRSGWDVQLWEVLYGHRTAFSRR
ncbi:MAG: TIGR03936 family radical SAM-associated protein [Eisenbergiella sp.]